MGLLRFRENHFVTGATQRPRQTFFGCRPPSFGTTDDDERVGTQHGGQRLQWIATQVYLDGRFYGTLARDYAKALLVQEGSGPLVLLVHGFPESWYSWRHQLPVIAEAGFRAVAIDVRGYGRSSAPLEVEAYGMLHHVNDNLGVVEALTGRDSPAVVIGHDWGAPIVANSALLRPDIFTAVAMLSVPYSPPGGRRPTDVFAERGRLAGPEEEFYINYFQEPGRAEREA